MLYGHNNKIIFSIFGFENFEKMLNVKIDKLIECRRTIQIQYILLRTFEI